MPKRTIYITTASWEPRFILGTARVMEDHAFSKVLCFWFQEFGARTEATRAALIAVVADRGVHMVPLPMYSSRRTHSRRVTPSYAVMWKNIRDAIDQYCHDIDTFILDITTMPREALWIVLDLLTEAGVSGEIVYHRAEKHGDWCGAEPERPHIVPKLGGLPVDNLPTRLLIVSGYDGDRSEQFIASYEPQETLILFQNFAGGSSEENRLKNEERHRGRFGDRGKSISLKGVDCFAADWGYSEIYSAASEFGTNSNIILASLGPKTSAISLYKVHRQIAESSLVYASCKMYNEQYSYGIGATLWLDWNSLDAMSSYD